MNFLNNILDRIANAFHAKPDPRYVQALEEENARLRAENRALLNSLLGTAGIPPLDPQMRPAGPMTAPTRRRSWPQIAAERESAAARHIPATRDAFVTRDSGSGGRPVTHRPASPTEKTQ
jgi:hypothetical protein